MRTPLIAGNWKMHKTLPEARELVSALSQSVGDIEGVEVLICPPVQLLFPMAKAVAGTGIMLGAQNMHEEAQGAFTGEVSAAMLKETGCSHVIIGHSERRHIFGEVDATLAKKVRAGVSAGLQVIYCVGETLEQREADQTKSVVERQIRAVLGKDVPPSQVIVAYEPVWAIGTGKTATPEQAQEVHEFIRSLLATIYDSSIADTVRILYGGSVKPGNATDLLGQPDIDGALVGGACLVSGDFLAIIGAGAAQAASAM